MTLRGSGETNRENPYSFDPFLKARDGFDYYSNDDFLKSVLKTFAPKEFSSLNEKLVPFSRKVSFNSLSKSSITKWYSAESAEKLTLRMRCP